MAGSSVQTLAPQPCPWGMANGMCMSLVTVTYNNGDTSYEVPAATTGMSKIHHVDYSMDWASTTEPVFTYSTSAGTVGTAAADPTATKTMKLMIFGEI